MSDLDSSDDDDLLKSFAESRLRMRRAHSKGSTRRRLRNAAGADLDRAQATTPAPRRAHLEYFQTVPLQTRAMCFGLTSMAAFMVVEMHEAFVPSITLLLKDRLGSAQPHWFLLTRSFSFFQSTVFQNALSVAFVFVLCLTDQYIKAFCEVCFVDGDQQPTAAWRTSLRSLTIYGCLSYVCSLLDDLSRNPESGRAWLLAVTMYIAVDLSGSVLYGRRFVDVILGIQPAVFAPNAPTVTHDMTRLAKKSVSRMNGITMILAISLVASVVPAWSTHQQQVGRHVSAVKPMEHCSVNTDTIFVIDRVTMSAYDFQASLLFVQAVLERTSNPAGVEPAAVSFGANGSPPPTKHTLRRIGIVCSDKYDGVRIMSQLSHDLHHVASRVQWLLEQGMFISRTREWISRYSSSALISLGWPRQADPSAQRLPQTLNVTVHEFFTHPVSPSIKNIHAMYPPPPDAFYRELRPALDAAANSNINFAMRGEHLENLHASVDAVVANLCPTRTH